MEPPIEDYNCEEPMVLSLDLNMDSLGVASPIPLGSDWLDDFCMEMDAIISFEAEACQHIPVRAL